VFVAMVASAGASCSGRHAPPPSARTIRVPQDVGSIQAAVDRSLPGDVILVDRGTYRGYIRVTREHHDITIRGVDRNGVLLDGRDREGSAVDILADGVTLENLTAHSFRGNAITWEGVRGFVGTYLTVWNVGGYGIYAVGSRDGRLAHDFVSGAANSAFYVGECRPCDTTLTDLTARLSGIGYSGTNAGGGLLVRDSRWDRNGTGILPNSYDDEAHGPQVGARFVGNRVTDSGDVPTPASDPLGGFVGIGIGLAGGMDDVVGRNTVTGSARYGIALFPTLQRGGGVYAPAGNTIRSNRVAGSGVADLAVAAGTGPRNCFQANAFGSSLPESVEVLYPCGGTEGGGTSRGDPSVAAALAIPAPLAYARAGPRPSYTTMPSPGPQPTMPSGVASA